MWLLKVYVLSAIVLWTVKTGSESCSSGVACVCCKPVGHILDAQRLHAQQLCSGAVQGIFDLPL